MYHGYTLEVEVSLSGVGLSNLLSIPGLDYLLVPHAASCWHFFQASVISITTSSGAFFFRDLFFHVSTDRNFRANVRPRVCIWHKLRSTRVSSPPLHVVCLSFDRRLSTNVHTT